MNARHYLNKHECTCVFMFVYICGSGGTLHPGNEYNNPWAHIRIKLVHERRLI